MSALDKIRRGKRLTADFLYELLYGIANGDLATQNNNLPYWRNKSLDDHVIEGCVWAGDSYGSTLLASMSAGLVMINGNIVSVDAVANRAFTASKDTYIDIGENGAISYTEVSNNAASPALAANSLRLGIVVTGASSIASVASINQGQNDKVLPISSSVPYTKTDSLGNVICNRNPHGGVIGYRHVTAAHTPVSGTYTYPELVCPVIIPENRQIKVTASIMFGETNTTTTNFSSVYVREDGSNITTGSKYGVGYCSGSSAATNNTSPVAIVFRDPSAGSHTYGAACYLQGKDMSVSAGWIMVELV
jgi:hypothetical protein